MRSHLNISTAVSWTGERANKQQANAQTSNHFERLTTRENLH